MAVGNSSTPFIGYDSYLGVAEETTFGTLVTATSFIEFSSESFKREREEIKIDTVNNSRDYLKRLSGNESAAGGFESMVNPGEDALVYFIKQCMGGSVTSTTITASAYTHVINGGDMESNQGSGGSADIKSLTVQIRKGDTNQYTWQGCRVNSMSLKGEVGSPLTFGCEVMAKTATATSDSLTASFSNVDPSNFTGVTVQTSDSIGGSWTTEYFSAFEVSLNNNISEQRALGSANVHALPPGRRDVSIKLSQQYDTTTNYTRFVENTQTAIQITLDTGATIAAGGSSTYSMKLAFPRCYFNSNMPEVSSNDVLTHEVELTAIRDTTTGYSMQVTVNNATANYAG
ncbi:MAG: hypothetical protein GY853_02335 [PVC group bacterium]|nr:hypothetical protein [PVC group bacterium]